MAKIEEVIKMLYKIYRNKQTKDNQPCPDEETLVCFSEGRLSEEEHKNVQRHILICERCAQVVSLYNFEMKTAQPVPDFLIEKAKGLVKEKTVQSLLEITFSIKEKLLEIIKTSGDIVLGSEIIPLPVLRSRQIRELREELAVVKEFQDIRINVNIEKKDNKQVKITLSFLDKKTSLPLRDLRASLFKGDLELESYAADFGKFIFDKVGFGAYRFIISREAKELGEIKLEIV